MKYSNFKLLMKVCMYNINFIVENVAVHYILMIKIIIVHVNLAYNSISTSESLTELLAT